MPSQWAKKGKVAKPKTGKVRMTKKRRQAIADRLRECFGVGKKVK